MVYKFICLGFLRFVGFRARVLFSFRVYKFLGFVGFRVLFSFRVSGFWGELQLRFRVPRRVGRRSGLEGLQNTYILGLKGLGFEEFTVSVIGLREFIGFKHHDFGLEAFCFRAWDVALRTQGLLRVCSVLVPH